MQQRSRAVQASVVTEDSPERLAAVVEETEARCADYNPMVDASVNTELSPMAKAEEA
jgi:hypothetical protein